MVDVVLLLLITFMVVKVPDSEKVEALDECRKTSCGARRAVG